MMLSSQKWTKFVQEANLHLIKMNEFILDEKSSLKMLGLFF